MAASTHVLLWIDAGNWDLRSRGFYELRGLRRSYKTGARHGLQLNAIHRAGRDTQLAAGAQVGQHGMHVFGAADDGIDRAGLDSLGAADAVGFDDYRNLRRFVLTATAVVRKGGNT